MTELLRCPCCGGEGEMETDFLITEKYYGTGYYVECDGCGLRTAICETPNEAAAVWNRRVQDPDDIKKSLNARYGYHGTEIR